MTSLIGTLIVIIVVTVFAGFNKDYTCSINLLYKTFNDVPVFLAIMVSFVAGIIVSLPFVFVRRNAMKEKIKAKEAEKLQKEHSQNPDKKIEINSSTDDKASNVKAAAGAEKKFSFFGKKNKDDEKPAAEVAPVQGEKPVDVSPEAAAKVEEIDNQSPRMQ